MDINGQRRIVSMLKRIGKLNKEKYMDSVMYLIKVLTLALCWASYGLVLYRKKWDFPNLETVGWLMAVLGWTDAVL